jgi:ribosomal protein L29
MTLQNAVSPIENPKLINESKKTIARILTEKRARQIATA